MNWSSGDNSEVWFEVIERENDEAGELIPYQPGLLERSYLPGGTLQPLLHDDRAGRLYNACILQPALSHSAEPDLLKLQQEEKELGNWPRRLLHVASLTSYEWAPGNVYGGVKEPLYNAISYTWGRWEISANDNTTTALPVRNVPWLIPKVHPSCFSVVDFQNALKAASVACKDPITLITYENVEFVWLDVACISQEKADMRSAAEIGRQAAIFAGAQASFIWLHTLTRALLGSHCNTLRAVFDRKKEDRKTVPVFKSILSLLEDPWFSSLWTLQEAFLRTDSLLMAKCGTVVKVPWVLQPYKGYHGSGKNKKLIHYPGSSGMSTMDLLEIIDTAVWLCGEDIKRSKLPPTTSFWANKAKNRLIKAGLSGLNSLNPLSTYIAAQRRSVKHKEDQIYGIQQIFNLRLGSTSIEQNSPIVPTSGNRYSVTELQDQLGEKIMIKYPVLSQCHVFTRPTAVGKAWRVNETSVMLADPVETSQSWSLEDGYPAAPVVWSNNQEACKGLCRLDIEIIHGAVWGQFEGHVCPFDVFHQKLKEHEEDSAMSEAYKATDYNTFLDIWLDSTEDLDGLVPRHTNFTPRSGQRRLAELLSGLSPRLCILILGVEFNIDGGCEMLGMLMHECRSQPIDYWRRVGVCRWKRTHITASECLLSERHKARKEWFEGEGEAWVITRGIFG